jgi:hypothetical protein
MGFGSFIGGILLGILAVILVVFGFIIMLGLIPFIPTNLNLPFGIIVIIIAIFLLAYGWYNYKSAKPKGTLNVHNQ